jgi:hypothetical protein
MMNDDQNGGYVSSGFAFGGDDSYVPPAAAPAPAPVPAAPAPVAPVQPAPQQTQPTPPPPPAPAAPMGGMGDDMGDPTSQGSGGIPGYTFGNVMKTFTTTVKLSAHSLNFDENKFINLLAGSISLSREEKMKFVDSVPNLRQEQVDELIRIFEEEREKFVELSPKHGAQLKKLEDQHLADWKDLEVMYKSEKQSEEDKNKADEIRKQLGLN